MQRGWRFLEREAQVAVHTSPTGQPVRPQGGRLAQQENDPMLPTSSKWLAAALAAGVLAACGGGSSPTTSSSASSPTSAALAVQVDPAAALSPLVDMPVDSDRAARSTQAPATNGVYIVQLEGAPVTAYDGGIKGLQATRPRKGQKIDPDSPAVTAYMGYLASKHDAALRGVGNARKLYSYGYVFNGFAAELTDAQAQQLALSKGIVAVSKDEARSVDTSTTSTFLGLSGASGFWSKTGAKGENVIIGMVDSGIWPESPSFSDRTGTNGNDTQDGKLDYQQIPGWHGKCVPGDQFTASNCNQKLIGARYYNAGWGGDAAVKARFPEEFVSPRDWGGHGTHTASTAGGNGEVTVTGPNARLGKITGMAPRARIAAYKVCWSVEPNGGCFNSDSVAAIEQAVADGVDVINFSISGTTTNFRDPVEIAFMFAADAGVFVAASAGNSGPTTGTVAHPGPWLTTVAAGTHNRVISANALLGNGTAMKGISSTLVSASGPLVNSTAVAAAGASPAAVSLCFSTSWNGGTPALDPAKAKGRIVVCERGTNDRVDKSKAVAEAGGIGMILVNTSPNTLVADTHSVPTVHLADTYRAAVEAYAATTDAAATITESFVDLTQPAPYTASFSSRGPLTAGGGNLLKPDLIAPGDTILAAVAPPGNGGRSFDLYSGTSMSSPHVAGLAALFKELHPSWSPMAIKSALMTTAYDVLDGPGTNPAVIFRQGAGHVQPMAATDPGLVFDSGMTDWLGFLCGTQLPASFCTSQNIPVVAPSNMNVASIALGSMAGIQTVTRRVTNVGTKAATYAASYVGLSGITPTFSPASFTVQPGETRSFDVTFTRSNAPLNAYTGGQITLSDGTHNVRIPVVARPVALGAPPEVTGTSYKVSFGYDGPFTATPRGLVAATTSTSSVATNGFKEFSFTMPANLTYARFSLFDSDVSAPSDLDMEVYYNGRLVGSSGGPTAAEQVSFTSVPAGAVLTVRVVGYATPAAGTTFTLFSWLLDGTSAGNLTVTAPATATTGAMGSITLGTSGLASGTRYLGSVVYGGASNLPAPTIVRIDN
jgi:subtilisin family serine protease